MWRSSVWSCAPLSSALMALQEQALSPDVRLMSSLTRRLAAPSGTRKLVATLRSRASSAHSESPRLPIVTAFRGELSSAISQSRAPFLSAPGRAPLGREEGRSARSEETMGCRDLQGAEGMRDCGWLIAELCAPCQSVIHAQTKQFAVRFLHSRTSATNLIPVAPSAPTIGKCLYCSRGDGRGRGEECERALIERE